MAPAPRAALHLVNAWAVDNGLCPGQEPTSEKSSEITAVPLLLRQLELAGCIVTVDALNTQEDIAREIKEADADYVLALKGNPPRLHQEVSDFLLDAKARGFAGVAHDFLEEADKGHGRLESRRHRITAAIGWITPRAGWEGLRGVENSNFRKFLRGRSCPAWIRTMKRGSKDLCDTISPQGKRRAII